MNSPTRHSWFALALLAAAACSDRPVVAAVSPPLGAPPAPVPTADRSPATPPDGTDRPLVAPSRSRAGVFDLKLAVRGKTLDRNGTGLCEWGIFGIDLYEAALYAERPTRDLQGALEPPQTLVFHLHFVRGLTRAQLGEAFTAATKANTGERFAEHEKALALLVDAMQDVKAGDAYTFFCEPGTGLSVLRGGKVVATIRDAAFTKLFVQLYLGDQPPTKALRDGLLGGRKG